ncbi:MAG: transglycosylase domain-containing protein, partial [Silvanigrellaceae bacterium]|nr:transglycosylase domain-containing protein [Silvanigrellaceae bacterium]
MMQLFSRIKQCVRLYPKRSFLSFAICVLVAWFTPWVLAFYSGILVYFPYHADGVSRFSRVVGPVTRLWENDRGSSFWVAEEEIPKSCFAALVAAEDTKFYQHYGFDYGNIRKSMQKNQREKKIKRGGSTITQQLVKNAFLSRKKSYLRKAREMVGAILLDLTLRKDAQITWYFNIVEFGKEIYGIQEAAQFYFKKNAKDLNPSQCVALVTIIPSPQFWNRSLETKIITPFFRE